MKKSRRTKPPTVEIVRSGPLYQHDVNFPRGPVDRRLIFGSNLTPDHDKFDVHEETTISRNILPLPKRHLTINRRLPNLIAASPSKSVKLISKCLGLKDYKTNLISFWFADTMAELLRKTQISGLSLENQRRALEWFSYVVEMITVPCLTRNKVISVLEQMITMASEQILQGMSPNCIPLPMDVEVFHSDSPLITPLISKTKILGADGLPEESESKENIESDTNVVEDEDNEEDLEENLLKEEAETKETLDNEEFHGEEIPGEVEEVTCNEILEQFILVIEQIYRFLLNDFLFEVLQSTVSNPPQIIPVILTEHINQPKMLKPPETFKVEKVKTEVAKETDTKADKKGKKKKVNEAPAKKIPSFLLHPTQEEIEEKKREEQRQKEKDKYLLPLSMAADEEFFERLYPSPKTKAESKVSKLNFDSNKKGKKKK